MLVQGVSAAPNFQCVYSNPMADRPNLTPRAMGKESGRGNETHLGRALELVLGSQRDSDEVLVGVDERVRDGGDGRVVEGKRDRSNLLDTGHEAADEEVLADIEHLGAEAVTLVVDLQNAHTVGERRDVEHVEQHRLGGTDTSTTGDDLDVRDDFDRTTGNLGGNTKSLEERGLAWLHTGVAGGNGNVGGGVGTGTSGGGNTVGQDGRAHILEVTGGEDETDVTLDVGHELLELGLLSEDQAQSAADHGVLAHQNDTLAAEGATDLVHLVGADVVDIDNEDRGWMRPD